MEAPAQGVPIFAERGIFEALIGDARPLLVLRGLGLPQSRGSSLFLAVGRHLLPHELRFLGMANSGRRAIPGLPRAGSVSSWRPLEH